MNKCYIFGEDHTTEYRNIINDNIFKIHSINPFKFLILEEIGSNSFFTNVEKENAIKNHMYSVGPMGLELAIDLKIPAIGMDLWDDDVYKNDIFDENDFAIDIVRSFKLRETQMLSTIIKYRLKGNIAVIVGDSHLRTIKTNQLGDISPIHTMLYDTENVEIMRCVNQEIE